jgi:4-hydroxybenzoate polyprenyltransferase
MNDKRSSDIYRLSFIVYNYLKLIRPINLLMILFTQYVVRFAFLYPIFKYSGFSLQMNEALFAVFAFSFVFMAAAGYIINDYYDVEIDKVNKPGKVIIGTLVKKSDALIAYWVLSILGIIMGCWASYKVGLPQLGAVFFIYISGLWYYSTNLKYQFMLGNLTIAFFLAIVPLTAGIVELYADVKSPLFANKEINFVFLFYSIIGISLFAFISTLVREIVKDMEDIPGDKSAGCRTLPIVMGLDAAKKIAQFLLLVMLFLLGYLQYEQWKLSDWKSLIYISLFMQLPLIYIITKVGSASSPKDFHRVSTWIKILMVSGISYLFVFAYSCIH